MTDTRDVIQYDDLPALLDLYEFEITKHAQLPAHVATMIPQMRGMLDLMNALDTDNDQKLDEWFRLVDRFMRWLGFVQGVFWACGIYHLDDLRTHTRDHTRAVRTHAVHP